MQIGQRVELIFDNWKRNAQAEGVKIPVKGVVYTVRGVIYPGTPVEGILLDTIKNAVRKRTSALNNKPVRSELYFHAAYFKPVEDVEPA